MRHQRLTALLAMGFTASVLAAGSMWTTPAANAATAAAAPSAAPTPGSGAGGPAGALAPNPPGGGPATTASSEPAYTISQAVSDRAQLDTIAFDALGFLTGNVGADSFFPPGKVADFFGFQYLRDNDPSHMGHATDFLTSAAFNMLTDLTSAQRQQLITLATSQVANINAFATDRFVLLAAFNRLRDGELPAGTTGLSETAVKSYSATLYALDDQLSFARARVYGAILEKLTSTQRTYLDAMVGTGMTSWPTATQPPELHGPTPDVQVAVMTYASDMFSWYAGSAAADTYFCPERHGAYFGSFFLKDAPAVGNVDYSISTTLTGDMGSALLSKLTSTQAMRITNLVNTQRPYLTRIVATRQAIVAQLLKFKSGGSASSATVADLERTYGELDGAISYQYATAFAAVAQTLTATQRTQLMAMRTELDGSTLATVSGAYLYSTPIAMLAIPNTDFLFGSANK